MALHVPFSLLLLLLLLATATAINEPHILHHQQQHQQHQQHQHQQQQQLDAQTPIPANAPVNLRTELHTADQFNVNVPFGANRTRLQWQNPAVVTDTGAVVPNVKQAALEVAVFEQATSVLVFTTGQRASTAQQVMVEVDMKPMTRYCWQVRVVLQDDAGVVSPNPSLWSKQLCFDTEPDATTVWTNAQWIGGYNQLRTDAQLSVDAVVQTARVYVSGLGAFYLYINGKVVGDHVMDPPQTVYPKRVMYVTFDVSDYVVPGYNAIGAMLGNYKWGYTDIWCNMTTAGGPSGCQAFVMVLHVQYTDGTNQTFTTTPSTWFGRQGPVQWDHLFHGETFDARQQLEGWDVYPLSTWPAGVWQPVRVMSPPTSATSLSAIGPLYAMRMPPIRAVESFAPKAMYPAPDSARNSYIFEFPQNVAGFVSLTLPGPTPAGAVVMLEHAELTFASDGQDLQNTYCSAKESGNIRIEPCLNHQTYGHGHPIADRYIGDFNDANMTNIYITKGSAEGEEYFPLFAFAGFRYVRLTLPEGMSASMDMLVSHFTHTDVEPGGSMSLGTVSGLTYQTPDIVNRIHAITKYAQLSNLWSIPTDCPQRERRGWMGDAQVSCDQAMMTFFMQASDVQGGVCFD